MQITLGLLASFWLLWGTPSRRIWAQLAKTRWRLLNDFINVPFYIPVSLPLLDKPRILQTSGASKDGTPFLQRPVSHLHARPIYHKIQFVCDLWCLQDSFTADSCAHAVPFIEFLQQYIQGPKILLTLAQMRRVTLQWWHDLNWQGLLHFCTICIREILEEWQRVSLIIEILPLIIAWQILLHRKLCHRSVYSRLASWWQEASHRLYLLQVRRKADPAKNLVKEWVRDWRDAPSLTKEPSYMRISGKNISPSWDSILSRLN